MNAWAFLNYWGHVPGFPPKSTPMVLTQLRDRMTAGRVRCLVTGE